jgi:hypothetical protein
MVFAKDVVKKHFVVLTNVSMALETLLIRLEVRKNYSLSLLSNEGRLLPPCDVPLENVVPRWQNQSLSIFLEKLPLLSQYLT